MAKRKATARIPVIHTRLSRFVLLGISGSNDLIGSGTGRIDIKHDESIGLETIAPDDSTEYCRIVVRLRLGFSGRREKDEADVVRVEGRYEGRFMVHPGVSIAELDLSAADEHFQYGLVSQIYPLATNHLKEQLHMMGLTTRHLPVGI